MRSRRGNTAPSRRRASLRRGTRAPTTLVVVVLLCSALVAGCRKSKAPPGTSAASTTTASAPATAAPAPTSSSIPHSAGGRTLDLTWISNTRGWALEATPCPAGTCGQILSTEDGGVSWAKAATEPADVLPTDSRQCEQHGCAGHLRFASSTVGYLWGDQGSDSFFMSVDGGRTWTRQSGPQVIALEVVGGSAFRLVAPQGVPAPAVVERAAVGSSSWRRIDVRTGGDFGGTITAWGRTIVVAFVGHTAGGANDAHTRFARSEDGGTSWSVVADPCGGTGGGELDATVSAVGPGRLFGVLCTPRAGDVASSLRVSADGGAHFGAARPLPAPRPTAAQLALPSATVALFAEARVEDHSSTVLRTADGGRTWQEVLSAPLADGNSVPSPWLGFQDAAVARVSFGTESMWTSTDAGSRWTESQVS